MHRFANPTRFLRLSAFLLPAAAGLSALFGTLGIYYALWHSPPDYQQGEIVRVMYVHVPSAWMAMLVYSMMAAASLAYLIWLHPLANIAARASAVPGAVFTFITLVTGALWGKPTWGTWWVWDARLTSVLILFFLYLGYIAYAGSNEGEAGNKRSAMLVLIGFVNIPIIKFSVEWWSTLHQPASLLRKGGPAIDPTMLLPLLLMAAAFVLLYVALLCVRMRTSLNQTKIRRLQSKLAWSR